MGTKARWKILFGFVAVLSLSVLVILVSSYLSIHSENGLRGAEYRYFPDNAITESGKEMSMGLAFNVEPEDSVIVTVTLTKRGKVYYFDRRATEEKGK